ncbi:MAG: hypothetical protein ACOYJK_00385 [Prevotella sp.]
MAKIKNQQDSEQLADSRLMVENYCCLRHADVRLSRNFGGCSSQGRMARTFTFSWTFDLD